MKNLIVLLFMVCAYAGITRAEYAAVDGIRYELNDSLLTAAVVPLQDSVKYAGDIVIPEHFTYNDVTYTVTGIAEKAFAGSPRLTSVYLPNSVSIIDKDAFFECHQLSNIHLPENLERIGYAAFYQCGDKTEGIDTLIIPASCVYIDDFAFMFTPIRNLVIGDSVREIGHQAFMYMYLQNVVIGSSIERIGDHAFELAVGLNQFTCCAVTPPTLGKTVFATVQETMLDSVKQYWIDSLGVEFVPMQDRILYVPAGSVNWYRHSPQWQDFGTILPIQPEVATDHIIVDAEENEALFTWPTDTEAEKYIIDVRCDGEIFCHITLDGNGRLIGIAFAPARAPQSELPGTMSFMVTGLTEATRYTYTVAVLGEDDVVLHVYKGEFATIGYNGEINTGGNEIVPTPPIVPYDPIDQAQGWRELLQVQTDGIYVIDGQLIIRRSNHSYHINGQKLD